MVTGGAATALTDDGGGNFTATIDAAADGVMTVSVAPGAAVTWPGTPASPAIRSR